MYQIARLVCLVAALTGCTRFPALDGTVTDADRSAAFPALIPLDGLLALAAAPGQAGSATDVNSDIDSRIDRLAARANRLRGPVIGTATRARMQGGIATTALQ